MKKKSILLFDDTGKNLVLLVDKIVGYEVDNFDGMEYSKVITIMTEEREFELCFNSEDTFEEEMRKLETVIILDDKVDYNNQTININADDCLRNLFSCIRDLGNMEE